MSTFSTTACRSLGIIAAAAIAGPLTAAAASATSAGPDVTAPVDTAAIGTIVEPLNGAEANGASQFADTIPIGHAALAPSLGALPLAGPVASGLPLAGPVGGMVMPTLSGVSGGLPVVGPLVQNAPVVGSMISPTRLATAPATRAALPANLALPAGAVQTPEATQPLSLPSLGSAAAAPALPALGGLPLVGSLAAPITSLLHF